MIRKAALDCGGRLLRPLLGQTALKFSTEGGSRWQKPVISAVEKPGL